MLTERGFGDGPFGAGLFSALGALGATGSWMSVANLINLPCMIVKRSDSGATDDYGRTIETETRVETVCELQQQRRDEHDNQGEISDTLWQAFFRPDENLDTGDVLVVDGFEYEFVGDPWTARSPFSGKQSHIEATLRRTAGPGSAS